ncbi:MAG TPA: hypothetical protein VMX17_15795 [Candidatus Glassbacteria bacterium]|nr:hypothetical protein [Candidatus Glassbacteria bacterium]
MESNSRYAPSKVVRIETEDGRNITVNSYLVGPFGEFCAATVDRGANFLGTRIVPLVYVKRMEIRL